MANNLETSYPRIAIAAPTLNGNEKRYVLECLETTWISSIGRFITEFERAFARFCGVEHAVAVNNGTTALHLALVALGLKPGDEVIVPTLTYIATANAVTYCGAKPVLVDCDPRTLNMDPALLVGRSRRIRRASSRSISTAIPWTWTQSFRWRVNTVCLSSRTPQRHMELSTRDGALVVLATARHSAFLATRS